MPKRVQVYKVNVNDAEDKIALFETVGDDVTAKAIRTTMKEFEIPVDNDRVKAYRIKYDALAKKIASASKK